MFFVTVAFWHFNSLHFFEGFVDSKLAIVSIIFSLMLSSIYPLSFKYLKTFKLYLGLNFDKCSFLKFLLSIQRHEVDASSSKMDLSTSSPVRSLKVAFKCFLSTIILRLLFDFLCSFFLRVTLFLSARYKVSLLCFGQSFMYVSATELEILEIY